MADLKVGVDAGHGLGTPGKQSADGVKEWTYNNDVVKAFIAELNTYSGVKIFRYDDPTGKRDVPLTERTNKANKDDVDYYISFHENAGGGTGTETYTQEGVNSTETLNFAKAIHKGTVRAYGLKDRGLKKENFAITRQTNMPACLVEGAFMDNATDLKKLKDKKVLQNAGKQAAIEFAKFKNLKKKATAKPATPAKKPAAAKPATKSDLHKVIVDGKQEGVYGSDYNVVQAVERALKAGKKSIEIKEN